MPDEQYVGTMATKRKKTKKKKKRDQKLCTTEPGLSWALADVDTTVV